MAYSTRGTVGSAGGDGIETAGASSKLLDADLLQCLERVAPLRKRPHPGQDTGLRLWTARCEPSPDPRERGEAPALPLDDAERSNLVEASFRLDHLFQTLFGDESDLDLHLLLDATQSMGYTGISGSISKFSYARKFAAALGYVALARHGKLGICTLGHSRGGRAPILSGREAIPGLFSYLGRLAPGGHRDFSHTALNYAQRRGGAPGVCVILSDFLDPHWERAIRALFLRGLQIALVQVLDPEEIAPTFLDDLRLVDTEAGTSRAVTATPQLVARYRTALHHFCGQLSDAAERQGMAYLRVTTAMPFEDALLRSLREAGALR